MRHGEAPCLPRRTPRNGPGQGGWQATALTTPRPTARPGPDRRRRGVPAATARQATR